MALRAELYCYFCGHGLGEVLVPTSARRPTVEQLRTAYENVRGREAPVWNDGDQPLCPRCGAQPRAAAAARVTGHGVVVPSRPRRRAASSNARTTSEMRSSNGTPISSAPFSIMSRLTARAKALSFIFFRTDLASTSRTAFEG